MTKQKTKNIGSEEEASLDVFEAIKRAFIRRGFVRNQSKELAKPKMTGPEELIDLTIKAHDVLFKADTVFPFTLFPDTVTIDREKLTIANRIFFKVARITSIPIANVLSVEADVGPFFGSIHVTSRYFGQSLDTAKRPNIVSFLSRDDTIQIQHLLQGYIIAHSRKIDCANIDKKQLIVLLKDLGQGVSD